MSRRTVIASALSAAGLLAAGVLLAGAPAHAADAITASASSPSGSVGQLSITFTAGSEITSFTAHILTASGTDVLDLPEADFAMTSSTTTAGTVSSTWTISQPITTGQLLLGTYTVTVDATDAGSDSVAGEPAGSLDYLIQPTVTLAATPADLGYASPTTTLSGAVTGLWPDGSTGPIPGQQVLVTTSGPGSQSTAVTNPQGGFTMTVSNAGTFTASVQGSSVAAASSPPVTVSAITTPTQLTAAVSTTQTSYGQQVTVSGTLDYEPGTSFVPLSGMPVEVVGPGYPALSIPVTDGTGEFSVSFTAIQSGPVQVYFNNVQYQEAGSIPYLAEAQATTAGITVELPTYITQFSASVATSARVSVSGCLGVASIPPNQEFSVDGSIALQFSASRNGPWRRLGTITKTSPYDTSCGITNAEASFAGSFPVRLAKAYYRVDFTPAPGVHWLPSASSPVLAWKYRTEIKSLKASATRVTKGRKLTITGQLLQDTTRWVPYGHQAVLIAYRKPGAKASYWIVRVTTNADGKFTATVKDTFTATWSGYYAGNSAHYYCNSAGIKVTVR